MNSTVRHSFKVFFCCCVSKVHAGPVNNTRDQLEKYNFAFFSCSVADALLKKKKKKKIETYTQVLFNTFKRILRACLVHVFKN